MFWQLDAEMRCSKPGADMKSKKVRPSAPLTKAEYETLAGFRYMLRQFLRFSEESAESLGVTPQHHQALLAIKGFPGRERITIGELAERLQIKPHSALGLANRLISHGLIKRESSEEDRRQVYIEVTPGGADVLEKLSAAHKDELRRIAPRLREFMKNL
jgi:DNA-binding MarR family transcriptional regulator